MSHLPNRVELRLKSTGRVIGYTLSLIRDEAGEIAGAALFFKDLTRVEQLEERERLRDRLAALGEMAAAMAHELKNPLAGIEVMAGLLRRKVSDSPDAQSIIADIISEAKMANSTVVEMLDYVRPVRLSAVERRSRRCCTRPCRWPRARRAAATSRWSSRSRRTCRHIQGDEHQLCQVFTNLVINAFEAHERPGAHRISAWAGTVEQEHAQRGEGLASVPMLIVEIADDGPGIPDELKDRVFNAFFTTKAQGSGLGLAIVRKIVDAHDGRIDVTSSSRPGHALHRDAAGLGRRRVVPVGSGDFSGHRTHES